MWPPPCPPLPPATCHHLPSPARYYPGYWLYPFNKLGQYLAALQPSTLRQARTDTSLQWIIHSCGQATVCLEARRPGWGSYWLELEGATAKMRFRGMR